MKSLSKIAAVVFGLSVALTGRSAVVGYQITGTVNLVFGNPFNGITPRLGDPVTGLFIYDTSVPDLKTNALTLGYYIQNSPALLSYTLRGVKFESFGDFDLYVSNARSYDQIQVDDYTPSFAGQPLADNTSHVELLLDNLGTKHFVDDHLPASLNLANFNSTQGEIAALSGGVFSGVTFSINSLTPVSVPEPAVGILGLAGLLFGRKRQTHNRVEEMFGALTQGSACRATVGLKDGRLVGFKITGSTAKFESNFWLKPTRCSTKNGIPLSTIGNK